MPKLVRSRNYHLLPVQSPSSALPSSLYVNQAQHVNCTAVHNSSLPFLSSYSPLTPPWDTPKQHLQQQQQQQQQQRKVSEEDMHQSHQTCTGSSIDTENHNGSSSSSSGCDRDQLLLHSLSSVSSASSSNTSTTTLTRRKPSVCLTDLVRNEKDSLCATISPVTTSIDQRDQRIIDVHQELHSIRGYETGSSPPSELWGHFTSTANDDSFVNELDDPEDNFYPPHEDCWDYNTMAHATSFIPIKQRPHHCNNYITHSSTYIRQQYDSASNISPSSLSGGTSWRAALWSTNLITKSRNTYFDQHNHPYKNGYSFPTMTRQTIISRSLVSSQQSSMDRCGNHSIDSDEQQQSIRPQLQSSSSSSSSSSFNEFILTCPKKYRDTDGSMDIATQRMSVLGL